MLRALHRTGSFIIRINLIGTRTVYRQRRVSMRTVHAPLGAGWDGACTVTRGNVRRVAVTEFIASLPYQDTFVSNNIYYIIWYSTNIANELCFVFALFVVIGCEITRS